MRVRTGRILGLAVLGMMAVQAVTSWAEMVSLDFGQLHPTDIQYQGKHEGTSGTVTGQYWKGKDGAGQFNVDGVTFSNGYHTDWENWDGFAYSNVVDTETSGWTNQFAVYQNESGIRSISNSGNYVVSYCAIEGMGASSDPTITLANDMQFGSIWLSNTTYTVLSMLGGDSFAKKFGGTNGTDHDWLSLTIAGTDTWGNTLEKTYLMAEYLADIKTLDLNPLDDTTTANGWFEINLTQDGFAGSQISFSMNSSDSGIWGMNTPAYFALGKMTISRGTVVPEPGTWAMLMGMSVIGWGTWRHKRQSRQNHPSKIR